MGQKKSKTAPENALPANLEQTKVILEKYRENGTIRNVEHYLGSSIDAETGTINIYVSESPNNPFPDFLIHDGYYACINTIIQWEINKSSR